MHFLTVLNNQLVSSSEWCDILFKSRAPFENVCLCMSALPGSQQVLVASSSAAKESFVKKKCWKETRLDLMIFLNSWQPHASAVTCPHNLVYIKDSCLWWEISWRSFGGPSRSNSFLSNICKAAAAAGSKGNVGELSTAVGLKLNHPSVDLFAT